MKSFAHAASTAGRLAIAVSALLPMATEAQVASEGASAAEIVETRFDIFEFEIEGNSVLPVPAIERAVMPFLGPQKRMAEVEAARTALEKVYQDAGYLTVFVDVPEQRIVGGVVRLQVLEGRIERLKVSGSRYYSQGYIRSKVAELAEGNVPNFNEAQRQLAIVNRSEERRVQPVLRPGQSPGTVEVDLKVEDRLPLSANVELHNQHAPDTDPWRLQASLRYENLFQRDHALALTAITAPREPSQARVLVGTYTVPLDSGDSLIAYGVSSNSTVTTLGGTSVLGDGTTLGLRYAIPFFGRDGSTHGLTFGADIKDLKERVEFGGGSISTPLRYLPMQVNYTGQWAARGEQTQLSATFLFAARQLLERKVDCPGNVGAVDQFACKRQGADGSFATLRADLRHTESFGWGAAALRLGAQIASQPLAASSEQYSLGGADTVRGYLEGEGAGDDGLLGSFELRTPNFGAQASRLIGATRSDAVRELMLLAFVDAARVRTLEPAAGQAERVPLLGAGFGLRVATHSGISGALDVAWPRKSTRATAVGDARVHLRLGAKF